MDEIVEEKELDEMKTVSIAPVRQSISQSAETGVSSNDYLKSKIAAFEGLEQSLSSLKGELYSKVMEQFKKESSNIESLSECERKQVLERIFGEFMSKVRDSGDEAKSTE